MALTAAHFHMHARPLLFDGNDFVSQFGASPDVVANIWNMMSEDNGIQPKHLLWGLMFLKTYAYSSMLCGVARVSRKTFRKWAWRAIQRVAALRDRIIRLDNRFKQDRGRICKITVASTDCKIREPTPFNRKFYSAKFKGPGLRYEVGVCIQTGEICWINGPFPCGGHPDLIIFRCNLKGLLLPGEMVECNAGYRGDEACRNKDIMARARHETVNGDLKRWKSLNNVWRHPLHLHQDCFAAVSVVTQLTYGILVGPSSQA